MNVRNCIKNDYLLIVFISCQMKGFFGAWLHLVEKRHILNITVSTLFK